MFSPFGRSVPSLKINLISCCLRLMLLPAHCFKPQTMMSSREWEAELKCSATGNPRDWFRTLRRCSLKRSRSRLAVSPMYRQLQRRQEMQYTTFSDWQVKWSRMLCALFGPCREVWGVMCLHVWHRGRRQGKEPASVRDGEASAECTRISPRFPSGRYDTSGGSGKTLRASGSEDKMLKLSSKIRLVPTLNGL